MKLPQNSLIFDLQFLHIDLSNEFLNSILNSISDLILVAEGFENAGDDSPLGRRVINRNFSIYQILFKRVQLGNRTSGYARRGF
ncbi:hypothetical protein E2C01_003405 [Portunus trituberculatus]|uniref:Uncharacterized protein n=1 Tax=Portunus trituberculatus TaxID=210409 RepID=A0A5B7CQ28_PORTR|nr:hypothetical protein [Portunus trituberculatus]